MASNGTQTLALAPRKHDLTLATVATTGLQTMALSARSASIALATLFTVTSTGRVFNSRFSDRFKKT